MTIHNLYLVAGCALWVLILLVLYCRILLDRFRRFLRNRARSRIAAAFSPDSSRQRIARICRSFPRYARDEQLFRYICDCYCSAAPSSLLTRCMEDVLHSRISALPQDDPVQRQLLVQNIVRTRLTSHEIDQFLEKSPDYVLFSPLPPLKMVR